MGWGGILSCGRSSDVVAPAPQPVGPSQSAQNNAVIEEQLEQERVAATRSMQDINWQVRHGINNPNNMTFCDRVKQCFARLGCG